MALLIKLCTTIAAAETVATADLMTVSAGSKVDLAALLSDQHHWVGDRWVLRWVLAHVTEIPMSAIGAVVELIQIQLFLLKHTSGCSPSRPLSCCSAGCDSSTFATPR